MSRLKKILIALVVILVLLAALGWWLLRGDPAELTLEQTTGTDPVLATPDEQTIPTVKVAKPVGWGDDGAPVATEGLTVSRFAEGLDHPRVIYTMPNGDVLVTLTNAPERVVAGGWLTNLVAGFLFAEAGAGEPSPDQLVLLRDADGDGVAEERHVLRDDLSSPSGLAWADGELYVANHDALLSFNYEEGATTLPGEAEKLADLPAGGNHWMRNVLLSEDGKSLYIAVGSASNIAEGGMEAEEGRAAIHELNLETGFARIFGAGLRNPNGLALNPWSGELWTTVNERDMLGSDLVPDYLTDVPIGAHYGWPWFYYGDITDDRVKGAYGINPSYVRTPRFALGAHVAALGLVFSQEGSRMGEGFANGAFIARHGSWNRKPASGYDVIYVEFDERGNPMGKPKQVLDSFLTAKGETHGRPTWLGWDKTGALLVSDDTAGIIWRVMAPGAEGTAAIERIKGDRLPPQIQLNGDPRRAFENPPPGITMPGM
ncbi:MAG: sorbosone dehydrogenase [Sphingomonadales bacterium 32-64-17]|nr:MAG: sorbosone dehydrogenase [Sphingomonadales bacterium 32-64-17]